MITILVIIVVIAIVAFLYKETKSLVVTKYQVEGHNLPDDFDDFQILQISDLQSRYFGRNQEKIRSALKGIHCDIIVITGDFIDRRFTDYQAANYCLDVLTQKAPVYFVDGNHELGLDPKEYENFRNTWQGKVNFIMDSGVNLAGDCLELIGLGENTISKSRGHNRCNKNYDETLILEDIENISDNLTKEAQLEVKLLKGQYKVLLAHEPQLFPIYAKSGVDLVLAGHGHGGQIRLPFIGGLYCPEQGIFPKYAKGLFKEGRCKMIVSGGLGNSRFPIRLFNRPEIVLVEIKKKIV